MGSGIGEPFTQSNESCTRDLLAPLKVRKRFHILNEDAEEECDAVVEAAVSPSGAPAESTTFCEEPKKRWRKRRGSRRRWNKPLWSEECEGHARSLVEVLTGTVNSAEELVQ